MSKIHTTDRQYSIHHKQRSFKTNIYTEKQAHLQQEVVRSNDIYTKGHIGLRSDDHEQ